jgi:hypothetical protein
VTDEVGEWVAEQPLGRKIAAAVARVMLALLGVLIVLAVLAIVVYFLDQYFGWGAVAVVRGVLPALPVF